MIELSTSFLAIILAVAVAVMYFFSRKNPGGKPHLGHTPYLDQYTTDFTAFAKEGKIDLVIGREDEVRKLTQILSRRSKNNALLIGSPGVGKTAIVEALAQRIISEEVPAVLHDKRVLALDVANLLSGTKYRGEFEQRAKKIVHEIVSSNRSIILFIDEVHAVVQSQGTEGSINFSDILKPALARGELQLIGATTYEEYEKYIKTDLSLERRFQPIEVGEPTAEETLHILNSVKDKYREYHKVEFTDAALELAVTLTTKLIHDRKLPDKALDAIDEAGAMVKIAHLHPIVTPLLYQAAIQAHPEVAALWKDIQEIDTTILKDPKNKKKLIAQREELEEELSGKGILLVDAGDIEKVIKEWVRK